MKKNGLYISLALNFLLIVFILLFFRTGETQAIVGTFREYGAGPVPPPRQLAIDSLGRYTLYRQLSDYSELGFLHNYNENIYILISECDKNSHFVVRYGDNILYILHNDMSITRVFRTADFPIFSGTAGNSWFLRDKTN